MDVKLLHQVIKLIIPSICFYSAASEALYDDHGGMSFKGNFEEDEEGGDEVEGLVDDEIEEVTDDRVDGKTTGEESMKQEKLTCATYPTVEEEDEDINDPEWVPKKGQKHQSKKYAADGSSSVVKIFKKSEEEFLNIPGQRKRKTDELPDSTSPPKSRKTGECGRYQHLSTELLKFIRA